MSVSWLLAVYECRAAAGAGRAASTSQRLDVGRDRDGQRQVAGDEQVPGPIAFQFGGRRPSELAAAPSDLPPGRPAPAAGQR